MRDPANIVAVPVGDETEPLDTDAAPAPQSPSPRRRLSVAASNRGLILRRDVPFTARRAAERGTIRAGTRQPGRLPRISARLGQLRFRWQDGAMRLIGYDCGVSGCSADQLSPASPATQPSSRPLMPAATTCGDGSLYALQRRERPLGAGRGRGHLDQLMTTAALGRRWPRRRPPRAARRGASRRAEGGLRRGSRDLADLFDILGPEHFDGTSTCSPADWRTLRAVRGRRAGRHVELPRHRRRAAGAGDRQHLLCARRCAAPASTGASRT